MEPRVRRDSDDGARGSDRSAAQDPAAVGLVTRAPTPSAVRDAASAPSYALVDDLLQRPPLVLPAASAVPAAASALLAADVGAAIVDLGDGFAVLTDADIRTWVATGCVPGADAASIAGRDRPSVRLGTSTAEALITLLDSSADQLVVLSRTGELTGLVSARDFLVSPTMAGVSLHQQLQRATSLDELRRRAVRLPVTLRDITRRGLVSSQVIAVHSTLIDTIVRRTIDLVMAEHDDVDPSAITWLSLGSNGRREAVLSSDIDAAVSFDDRLSGAELDRWRAVLVEVVEQLARVGLTNDSNGATPARAMFARTASQWRDAGRQWLAEPAENRGAVLISLLVDGRSIHGDQGPSSLAQMFQELRTHPAAMRLLLQYALTSRARLRSVGDLLRRRGDQFNVKDHALTPIVNLARWAAMSAGSSALSTVDRLRDTAGSMILPQEEAATLVEIVEVLQRLRLRHQLAQLDAGERPTDLVDINRLSPIDRSVINQAVREIAAVQRRAANLLVSAPSDSWVDAER